ncbi:MAG TPA: NHLP-related RiPP peptide [Stenotrophomonas sp.]|jgi:putative modified peptide
MNTIKGSHPSLDPAIATELLSRLAEDDSFRDLFSRDPGQALRQLGLSDEAAEAALAGQSCLRTTQLASKEEIAKAKEALMDSLTASAAHTVVYAFESGEVASRLRLA